MWFGPVPLDEAQGAILAHSVAFDGGRMRKGRVLEQDDIARLRDGGVTEVTVALLGPDDVHEDRAALRLAEAVVPVPGAARLTLRPMGTGRVNIHAEVAGVAQVDATRINALNAVDPAITIATVREWQRMDAGGMVATVKIIAYAAPEIALAKACLAGARGLHLRPARIERAELIQTTVASDDGEKGQRVIAARLDRLGVAIGPKTVVPHRVDKLSSALKDAVQTKAGMILILTGSATSDIRDVAPEAVRLAGGEVQYFGMPVDPGNLLFVGRIGTLPVIGLPGCARSPALNGADWVLERIACAIEVTSADIAAMGVGGLLKEIPTRPRPREKSALE